MIGHGEKLTRKKEQAIVALLSKGSIEEAAKAAGIGVATLWRWLQRPDFKEEYQKARRDAVAQAIGRLQQSCSKAVKTLEVVMDDGDAPASARVAAAKAVLDTALKAIEIDDIQQRLEALEQAVRAESDRNAVRA
jgi:DNA-binding MurR/RpiR family transcriptional regulator